MRIHHLPRKKTEEEKIFEELKRKGEEFYKRFKDKKKPKKDT